MHTSLEVLFTPADFLALRNVDLNQTTCVVFDILRATTTMVTALANGATEIIPVTDISEALAIRASRPEVLLAGERKGFRIGRDLTGSVDFDLGNSPREFLPEKVAGKTIVTTTTNGTRALRAAAGAQKTLVAAFLNLASVAAWIEKHHPANLVLICSGTENEMAYEDVLGAGALCAMIWDRFQSGHITDSALLARQVYQAAGSNLLPALGRARNARRLLSIPELAEDVTFCAQTSTLDLLAALGIDGVIRRLSTTR